MKEVSIIDRLSELYNKYVNYDREVADTCIAAIKYIVQINDNTRHSLHCLEGKDE